MGAIYRFRFFFDFGAGFCLWSANEAASQRFGYPVDLDDLPLPESLRRRGWFILLWYDTFLDWENAPESSRWWPAEQSAFHAAAQEWLGLMREHLGPDFQIDDESSTAGSEGKET